MAYLANNLEVKPLNVFSGTGAGNVGHCAYYWTTDAAAAIEAANYFNSAWERLPKGTRLEAVMVTGGTPVTKTYVVTASSASGVTIAIQVATAG